MSVNQDTERVVRTPEDLGRALRELRRTAGVSQDELAAFADVHRTYLSGVEQGRATERLSRLFALVDALGLELVVRRRQGRRELPQ